MGKIMGADQGCCRLEQVPVAACCSRVCLNNATAF